MTRVPAQPRLRIAGTPKEAPARPEWLSAEAAQEWERLLPLLMETGHLLRVDADVLAAYCQAEADFIAAAKILDREGTIITSANGTPRTHPAFRVYIRASNTAFRLGKELGMTPLSRARLTRAVKVNKIREGSG